MNAADLYTLCGIKRIVQTGLVVLDIDELSLPEGRLAAVVGPNGAGKSMLLKTLAFLERPDRGEISFRGMKAEPKDAFSLRRMVTMVDQSPLLFHGNVFRNVAYGLKVRNVPRDTWETRVREALSLMDLVGFENRSVKGLSGGEIQRVAIARALVFRPDVVLLDEPAAGVDAARVEMLETLIREINARTGTNIIFSTHNLAQAYRLTNHVIHMSAGKTATSGTENIFSGQVESRDGLSCIRLRNGTRIATLATRPGSIRFYIPSTLIHVVPDTKQESGPNRFDATITRMEIRGPKIRLRLSGELVLRVEMDPEKLEEKGLKLGSRVSAIIPPEALRVLE